MAGFVCICACFCLLDCFLVLLYTTFVGLLVLFDFVCVCLYSLLTVYMVVCGFGWCVGFGLIDLLS